jgi:uncharacterized protein
MGRYATREEELDRMLRAKLFVDLYQVVRHAIRAGVESYSIKRLEPFYGFQRNTALADANAALAVLQANIELLEDPSSIAEDTRATVVGYNEDDCRSAAVLRDWLERLRQQMVAGGTPVPRPEPGDGAPNEKITDWLIRINAVIAKLIAGIPADPKQRTAEQQARWILANVIDWHRREDKAVWWEYFRLSDLSAEDLREEPCGLSGLSFVGEVGGPSARRYTGTAFHRRRQKFAAARICAIWEALDLARLRLFHLKTPRSTSRSVKTVAACTPQPFLRTPISIQR